MCAPRSQQESSGAAHCGEEQLLGEELTDDASAPAAEGAAMIVILPPRAVPRASIMLVRLRHAMSSTSDAMPMSSVERTVSSESLCGRVLMPVRASRATVISWSLFSTGSRSDEASREPGDHRLRPVDVKSRVEPPDQHERAVLGSLNRVEPPSRIISSVTFA